MKFTLKKEGKKHFSLYWKGKKVQKQLSKQKAIVICATLKELGFEVEHDNLRL